MERLTPDDIRQLDLLKKLFKIAAILFALGICCGLPHTLVGLGMTNSANFLASSDDLEPRVIGGFFMLAGLIVMAMMAAYSWACWQVQQKLDEGNGYT